MSEEGGERKREKIAELMDREAQFLKKERYGLFILSKNSYIEDIIYLYINLRKSTSSLPYFSTVV